VLGVRANNNMSLVGVYVPVSEVFPEVESTFEKFKSLLQGLSRTDTLFWCARLNLIISNPANPDHITKQLYGLQNFLTAEEIKRVETFVQKRGAGKNTTIFFRGQLLELIRWACLFCPDHPDDGITFEDGGVRRRFAQAALIASEIWGRRIYRNGLSQDKPIAEARRRELRAMRQGIAGTTLGMRPLLALGRGESLIRNYFSRFYPELEEKFRSRTGLSLEEYYTCLCAMSGHYLDQTPEKAARQDAYSPILNVNTFYKDTQRASMLCNYIRMESQTPDDLRQSLWGGQIPTSEWDAGRYDYKSIRERPVLHASDGRAIILDPVFFSERASVGPLFTIIKGERKVNEIFGYFGNAFEAYTCDILKRMYPDPGPGLVNRLTCSLKGKEDNQEIEISDACLNDFDKVVLFEIKAVFLPEDKIADDDYETLINELRRRYGVNIGSQDRIQGVGQLARAISKLANDEWEPLGEDLKSAQRIYPVLLVHDSLLDAPCYTNFLAAEFAEALAPDKPYELGDFDMKKGRFRVMPLIVMTIDDLENLEESVKRFGLRELLEDYSARCRDRMDSLHNFIALSDGYRSKIRPSESVMSNAKEVLDRTKTMLFPNASTEPDD